MSNNLEIVIVVKGDEKELKSFLQLSQETKCIEEWSYGLNELDQVFLLLWCSSKECLSTYQFLSINLKSLQIKIEMLDSIKKYIAVHQISKGFVETFSCIYNSPEILEDFVSTHQVTEITQVC